MKNLCSFLLLVMVLFVAISCTGDDADEPLIECPDPSFLSGRISQVEAIQKEIATMEAALPNTPSADRDALVSRITQAKEREEMLLEELSNYRHCL